MNVLVAIDSSGPHLEVAVSHGEAVAERFAEHGNSHDEALVGLLEGALSEAGLKMAQVQHLVIGAGPGSFTGLRIGFAFMKGLSLALRIPLVSFNSHHALATGYDGAEQHIAVVSDARRDEYFYSRYDRVGSAAVERETPVILPVTQLLSELRTLEEANAVVLTRDDSSLTGASLPLKRAPHCAARGLLALCKQQHPVVSAFSLENVALLEPSYLRKVAAKTIAERSASREGARTGTPKK